MPESLDTTSEDKDEHKASKSKAGREVASVFGKALEAPKRADAASKLTETSALLDRLIPKDGREKSSETPPVVPAATKEKQPVETAETAEDSLDPTIENLTVGEKAEIAKDYAASKLTELEAGRSDSEDPAEAAAREANIEFLHTVQNDAEATPLEPIEEIVPEASETVDEPGTNEIHEAADIPAEFSHDEAIELNTPTTSVETTSELPPAPPVAGSGSAGGPPEVPQAPRTPATPPPFDGGFRFKAGPATEVAPRAVQTSVEDASYRNNEGTAFLVGGILGYMLGRRRGRIKTERRMKAVSKKLEAQIKETRDRIAGQEVLVRQQARDQYHRAHRPAGVETVAQVAAAQRRPETITDLTQASTPERSSSLQSDTAAERVQQMKHHEVLALAEKVVIDGTSLRTIYEAKQITEPGLRRIAREYLRGGDVKAVLNQEVKIKEMQYERDPQMRDRLAASYANVDAAQPRPATEALASILAENEQKAVQRSQAQAQTASADNGTTKRTKQVLVSAWAVFVVVLVVIAVVLASR